MLGLLVQLKNFYFKKTSKEFKKHIFRALQLPLAFIRRVEAIDYENSLFVSSASHTKSYITKFVLISIFTVVLLSTSTVESQFSLTRKLDTINVFSERVESTTWKNIEALSEQNVSKDGLYQEFSKNNSAYRDVEKIIDNSSSTQEPQPNEQIIDSEIEQQPIDIQGEGTTETSSPEINQEINTDTEASSDIESESSTDSTNEATELPTNAIDEPVSQNEYTPAEFGLFKKVTGVFTFAQESVTSSLSDSVSDQIEIDTESEEIITPTGESITEDIDLIESASTTEADTISINENSDVNETTNVEENTNTLNTAHITFSDFALPNLESGQFITNVQLRMSLAALITSNREDYPVLDVEYLLNEKWENAGSVILDGEVSNALNGGYYLFALPTFTTVDELDSLSVRITERGELLEEDTVFIDAVWLEVDTETFDRDLLRERLLPEVFKKLSLPRMHTLLSDTLDFSRDDDPVFVLRYESQRNAGVRFLRNIFGRNLAEVKTVTFVRKGVGIVDIEPLVDMTNEGLWTIQLPQNAQDDLEPGTYTIEIVIDEGGKVFTDSLDFQWGLLAVNPHKTEYEIGEVATIALAALSPSGNTLCDAELALYIIDPLEYIHRSTIQKSGLCNGNNVIDVPDYSAEFTPTVSGEYEMYVENIGTNGEVLAHTVDTFMVVEQQSFSITRQSQTRIYPRAEYSMALRVEAEDAYVGELMERVPRDFVIGETDASITMNGDIQELRWGISLKGGIPQTFTYSYDAPDISPFLYTLGPAEIGNNTQSDVVPQLENTATQTPSSAFESPVIENVIDEATEINQPLQLEDTEPTSVPVLNETTTQQEPEEIIAPETPESTILQNEDTFETVAPEENAFEIVPTLEQPLIGEVTQLTLTPLPQANGFIEHRRWQIASDATGSMIVFWTDGASIPSGWTCISCTSTSTFYQRFPLGGATYGTQAGVATTTHTADGAVNASGLSNAESFGTSFVSINSHSHTITPIIGSTTTLPAYRQLRVIQNNSAGSPATVPAGAILIFDGSLPSGWVQYTDLDSRYPRGENAITSAGSNTHIHTATATLSAASGSTYDSRTGGTQVTAAGINHTHTLSTSTPPVNHEPAYMQVIFATSSIATATPLTAIALWSDTPPAGWLNRSAQPTDPFYNRYIKGGSTYGTTGGGDSHTQGNFTASSSAAVGTDNARTGTAGSSNTHTHAIDLSNFSTASNTPPSVTVIYAKYYGLVPIYTQSAFRWYVNANSVSPTDAWPTSTVDVLENEAIDTSFTPLKNGDVLRLRLQLNVSNSTTTGEDFKLQFGTTTALCTAVSAWTDVGSATSSAAWIGHNNSSPSDGATLSTSTLTGTDVLETYEEQNPTIVLPNAIGIGQEGEWDFVLKQNAASPNTNYCFRMVEADGTELFAYTQYPLLITNAQPNAPSLHVLFDNEKVSTTTPQFEFAGTDAEADDLTYQIQIDSDYTFGSVDVDRNSASNPTQFANIISPADKNPYTNGETIRFSLTSALTNNTTYYWRVRTQDPTGSNNWGSWSTIFSFTIDSSLTNSAWFQTTEEQFDTDTLVGTDALATDLVQLSVGSTTGTTTSSQIDFLDGTVGNAWGSLSFNDDETVGDIKYRIQYYSDATASWANIPDIDLSGNSAGFDTSPVSLLSLNTDIYRLIRIVAVFTNSGGSPLLYDWTITWGYRIETPTLNSPFPNEKVSTTTPTFEFETTDPQSDDLEYEIQWSTTYAFTASTTRNSSTSLGFINSENGGDTSPFTSGQTIQFTVQPADILTNGTTYWWRVRARDPLGSNQFSLYTDPLSFTVDTSTSVSTWFQTTQSQFETDVLSGTIALVTGSVTVATTSDESLMVYAEGIVTTPRYREWDGTTWSSEASALGVGAPINWIVTKASPIKNEFITGTLGTDADVNIQVFKNGSWGNIQEITTSIPNTNMRGFDIAYEQTSGDALVVACDGDADPSYYVWNGSAWVSGGTIDLTAGNSCGWIKLVSNPTSDEIIVITRDTSGTAYETLVWSGSAWGTNRKIFGSMQSTQANHEGIAAEYEESGNQAVIGVSNGTASSFIWTAWASATWTVPAAVALGDDFESGTIVADDGSDNLALCYIDHDNDIGAVRWTGAAWAGQTELEIAWAGTDTVFNDRPVDCSFEVGGARDGYIMVAYSDTTNVRHRAWNGTAWDVGETNVSTIQDAPRVQLRRTGANLIQLVAFDDTNDRYDYSYWNGTIWNAFQTLETDASVGATPFKEPFMNAVRNPGIIGSAVVSPGIDFYDGSGPYWAQLSWTDSEAGGSTVLYQVEYYDGDSWELVPNGLIPGNSTGTTTSPINLSNVLPVSTYNEIRPVANLTCNLGTCPSLSDWTVTWAAGISISGTAQAYDQSTNVISGTVGVSLNGVLQVGKTGTISGGVWSIANVNAAPGDIVSVFVNGANDINEAVSVTRYDGIGDITGMRLYERHLALGSNDATSTPFTNAEIGLYDFTNDEDIFFDLSGTVLTLCADVGCGDVELYTASTTIYRPQGTVVTHDIEINGTFRPEGNTIYLSGSWDNNGTTTSATSTVVFTATSTNETIDETSAISPSFYNLTFGTTTGNATWTPITALDVNGALSITRGTFSRASVNLNIAGNTFVGVNGFITGVGTTTFDGTGTAIYTDSNAVTQNIGRIVVDGTSKTLQLGSAALMQSINIGSDDILDVSTSNYSLTVLTNFINSNTYVARSGTTTFAGTTTNLTITAGGDAFYNLAFTGAGGSWSFTEGDLSIGNDFVMSTGTITMPTGTTTVTGTFANNGGTFAHNNATVVFDSALSETVTLLGTAFTNAFYNVRFSGSGSWVFTESNATTSNDFRITQGTVVLPSSTLAIGGHFANSAGTFAHNNATVRFTSSSAKTIDTNSSFNHLTFVGSGSWSFIDTNVTALEDVSISNGTVTFPSNTFTIGGSLINSSTLTHNSGTVLFNSIDSGETIALGNSPLHNLLINSGTGGWTVSTHATTTGSTTLTSVGSFTVTSGQTLSVGGVFTNSVGGASTTWTGSTLSLESGAYSINLKTSGADAYNILRVKANTDIKMWNSSASSYTIDSTGSLYSQDHSAVDGDLYIFGGYERTSGTEYWSYATDFDGTSLGTSSRQVDVRFASGANATFTGSVFTVMGTTTGTTTIRNQGSGTYTLSVSGGTSTASYYDFGDLGLTGVSLQDATKVTSFGNGRFAPGINTGTGLTVSSSTIDVNAGLQIFGVEFSTTTAITATNVTQTGGVPLSYWWFRNSAGNIDGEAFDSDTGDPGSVRWDDSSLSITVSGIVYDDDETTPLGAPTCGVGGTPVRIVVENGGTYDGACDGSGVFTIPGVVIVGDPTLTVFLNGAGGGKKAVTVTKTPTENITDLNLIVGRVITRHEDTSALTIEDMATYDSTDDGDIPFTAATGTSPLLTVHADNELHIASTTTFAPAGTVTVIGGGTGNTFDGSLHIGANATFTGAGTTTYSIGGSLLQNNGGVFSPASSTILMTATTTGKGVSSVAGETIYVNELQFSGVGGGWNQTGTLSSTGNIYLATGTLTGTGNITLTNGSFYGNGLLSLGSGTTTLSVTNTLGGTQAWTFGNLVLGTGSTTGTTTPATNATTTVLGKLTIGTGHFFGIQGGVLDLQGSGLVFVENGNFVEGTSTVRYSGTQGSQVLSTNYYNLVVQALGGSPTYTGTGIGISVLNNLTVGGTNTTTLTLNTNDPALDVNGNVSVLTNGTLVGSNSAIFNVAGSWDNDGTYTGSGGTVTFDGSGIHAIAPGSSAFSNAVVNATGNYTLTESATATAAFTITTANDFIVSNNVSLAIGGTFTNSLGGADTVWNSSTLYLYGGGDYQINASTTSDTYSKLSLGTSTQIRMWNSSASSTDLASTASLYSQDHGNSNGDLYVYGSYIKISGTDYWSYATDFDGTILNGTERQVDVRIASNGSMLYTGGGLAVVGVNTGSTTIQNQGSGTYSFRIGGTASTTWSYYDLAHTNASGLTFSGTPSVTNLSYGNFTLGIASGTALTVGGSVIDQNPAKTFTNNNFSTSTGVSGFNVTATSTTVSSWRFTNHSGSIDGESYDFDPDGDPGYIVWDDSSASLSFSGRVYSDEGTTASGVGICNGVMQSVTLRVAGLTTYTTDCDLGTGAYSISGITYSPGDSFVVYLTPPGAERGSTVSEDPVTSIGNLDIYENRVIVRHESSDPLSIADMSLWDSSDDANIPFTAIDASPDTLTLPANRKLLVWTGKEFEPNGNVTVSGGGAGTAYDGTLELFANAIFDATGSEVHTIGGNLIMGTGATFDDETSAFTFTTTGASRTIDTNDQSFYNLTINGSGSFTTPNAVFDIGNDFTLTQGTVTLPTGTTTVAGSFLNTGGTFIQNGGHMRFTGSSAKSIRAGSSSFGTTTFAGTGTYTYLSTNATTTGDFTILSGTVSAPTGTLSIGGDFTNMGIYTHNSGIIKMTSALASTTIAASSSDLGSLTIAGAGTFSMTNTNSTLAGTLSIQQGALTLASGTLSVGGSFLNTGGSFAHASGTILFNSADTGESINGGTSEFNIISIAAPSGGYTITGNATTTGNFSLTSATQFTLQNGLILNVGRVFTNLVGGAATTWTGSTIKLGSGSSYTVNSKTTGSDVYNVIALRGNTDIRLWNSSATTTLLDSLSSLYSQDNAAIDGELYIYGDYSRTTGADYWSYATDFDGTSISTSSRAVTVRHASGATSTFSGGTLSIIGAANATTTITNQGSGTYAMGVSGGTLSALNYAFRNSNATGLSLSGTTTVTSIANGDFELALNGGSLLTVSSTTINYNASMVVSGMRFATTSVISGTNISVVGTTPSSWTFTTHRGNLAGESYDNDGIDACGSIRWSDSACLLTQQSAYRWRQNNGGEGVPDSEWFDTSWSKRKRITVTNSDAIGYTNAVVEVTIPYDSDMQTDFDDLRVTNGGGTTTLNFAREIYTASTEATIWVKIPILATSTETDVYVYYGNGGATYGGVGTSTFSVYDDFEDDNITEYSGDTTLFNVGTAYAYQGTYGLDASGNETNKTIDGIYRTSVTVSQGETIRFLQNISAAGTLDEVCTLFGVQSPGSNNNNYAICLEQVAGTDRMSIAENVQSSDSDGTGVVLASTTVAYSPGWYEVEIRWGTNNTILATLYDSSDVFVASTSVVDTSYTSGGIGFTYWFQSGGWDHYTSRALLATEPTATLGFEQGRGGASWLAALNTKASGVAAGTIIRPRFVIENTGLQVIDAYRLMYADKGASPSCEAVSSGSYSAVPLQASCTGSPLCMQASTHFVNNASTTDVLGGAGTFTQGQIIEDPSNTTQNITIPSSSYTEVEYSITVTNDAVAPNYCLRVSDNGTDIDSYTRVAELELVFVPNITALSLNAGNDIILLPGVTTTIYATGTVTDQNGYADIVLATTTMFRSGVGESCSVNTNNCYIAGPSRCSYSNCSGDSCNISCTSDFYFHTDPTDTGSTFDAETWRALLRIEDQGGSFATATAPSIDLITLRALDVNSLINYGSLEVNANTGSYNASTTFQNLGNDSIDVAIEGTNLSDGVSSAIPVNEQIFATSTFTYSACVFCTALSASSTNYELDLTKPASTTPPVTDDVFWGIEIPFGISAAPHQGTNIFYAISD